MLYEDWAKKAIRKELQKKKNVSKIIEKITNSEGKVAFYPCSKYCRNLLKEILNFDPNLLDKILGCFDKSSQANSEPGVQVYSLDQLNSFTDEISLLVIASSTYYARQEHDILSKTQYRGPVLKTSYFDYSIPEDYSDGFLLQEIERIMDNLHDNKSKMVYLTTWLSRIINDEKLTHLFESENKIPEHSGDMLSYGKYTISGIHDDELKTELYADVYKMRYVHPLPGDCVLDIGAFRGETAIVFADTVGETGKVYAFEPILGSYDMMKQNISQNNLFKIIEPVNMGCSNKTQQASAVCVDSGAPWNFISENDGTVPVSLTTIDEFIISNHIEKVDFIKMDVEGFENDALQGAREVIKRDRPQLAIALYHKSSDMFTIPDQVMDIINDYELYIRCNMAGPYGLTLFCR